VDCVRGCGFRSPISLMPTHDIEECLEHFRDSLELEREHNRRLTSELRLARLDLDILRLDNEIAIDNIADHEEADAELEQQIQDLETANTRLQQQNDRRGRQLAGKL
jgi:hypothetical protein